MNIDRNRLRLDIGALAVECRAAKDVLRQTWTKPMADEQRRLVRLRHRMTELCVLTAHLRGKRHVKNPPFAKTEEEKRAWQEAIATRVAKDYLIPEVTLAEGGAS